MKKIITLLMLMFIVSISFAQYTPMTAAGYQFKRILCDSTLHIPSFCGIPTLRNSTAKNGAIAMDTCNNKLYKWTRAAGWSDISGGGIDSLKRSTDSIFARKAGVWVFQYKDSVGGGGGGSQNLQQVTDLGNTTTNALIVDDALAQVTKLGLTDYLNNLVYPFRYSNVFGSAFDLKDDLSGFPPFLNGYSSTLGDAFYKMGIESNKAILQVDGGSNTNNSSIKLTENELRFSEGGNVTSIKTNPSGNSASYFLPMNVGVDQTLLADAPNDGSKYARQNGTWVSFTTGGGTGTVTDISQGYGITASPTNPITTSGTIDVDTTTSGLSGKYLRIVDTTGKWASATASFVPYTGATLNVNLGDKTLKGEAIYAKESFYLRDTTLSGNYLVIQKDGDKGAILFANNSGGGLNGNVSLSVNNMSGSARTINLPDSNGTVALKEYTIDSLKRSSDSVYARKNGQWNFQFRDSVGSGGGGSQNGRFGNDTATVVMAKIHNNSGTTLTNGKVVFLASSGTNADAPSVRLANNKHDSTSANTFGFVSGSIANNDTGWVILSGIIEKLNTSAFANGDIIYLDSISGNWTKSKPIAPYHMVYLGVVVKANAGNGSIFVKCQNGYELDEIHDVQINGKLNNQVLAYSDTQKVWKNRNIYALVDTTPFQRKNISANTIMANNTASAANVTAQAFYDVAEQAMGNTITWTGTAPTSLTSANYTWQQIGKTVNMQFNLLYANAGASTTGYFFTLPSDMPAPLVPTGWTGASGYLYTGSASTHNTSLLINSNVAISFIRRNAANTAFEVGFIGTGVSARGFKLNITYKVP